MDRQSAAVGQTRCDLGCFCGVEEDLERVGGNDEFGIGGNGDVVRVGDFQGDRKFAGGVGGSRQLAAVAAEPCSIRKRTGNRPFIGRLAAR